MPDPTRPSGAPAGGGRSGRAPSDLSPWNLLLLVPLLTVLYPPLYNRTDPTLLDIPFFYWYQLAMIGVSVACTLVVYRATERARAGQGAGRGSAGGAR
jgi:hypothetical protein